MVLSYLFPRRSGRTTFKKVHGLGAVVRHTGRGKWAHVWKERPSRHNEPVAFGLSSSPHPLAATGYRARRF